MMNFVEELRWRGMLHDIRSDYGNHRLLETFHVTMSEPLPESTNTTGEWKWLDINFMLKIFDFTLVLLAFELKDGKTENRPMNRVDYLISTSIWGLGWVSYASVLPILLLRR